MAVSMTWPQYLRGECVYRGRFVRLPRKQADLLLLYLLRRGTIVPVSEAAEFLWPDADNEPDCSWHLVRKHSRLLDQKMPGAICLDHGFGRIIEREAA
jgi:hypothetical protein